MTPALMGSLDTLYVIALEDQPTTTPSVHVNLSWAR